MAAFTPPAITDEQIVSDHQPGGNFWGYLLEEDYGLKSLLEGIKTRDAQSNARPIRVQFETPEKEQRGQRWPYISIKFLDQQVAHWREHRGLVPLNYKYLQGEVLPDGPMTTYYPIPIDLFYRVTTHARLNAQHAQMISALTSILHPRFAQMTCPGDTVRRIDVLSMVPSDGEDESKKRVFRMTYRLRIPTEIETPAALGTRVQGIVFNLIDTETGFSTQFRDVGISKTDIGSGSEAESVQER